MFSAVEKTSSGGKLWMYWQQIETYIKDMINLPVKILQLRKANEKLLAKTKSVSDKALLQASIARLKPMQTSAETVRAKIDSYLPSWQKAEKSTSSVKGFGLIPLLVLGGASAIALGYVAIKGMTLIKEYKQEEAIMQQVANRTLTVDEAQALIKSVKSPSPLTAFMSSFGSGIALPLVIVGVGVGGYFAWKSGMFKGK
jgi:hypothetical protein